MSVKRVERVDLHIGPPKSGTTFLQNVLFANKQQLLSDGVALPRQDPRGMWRSVSHLLHRDPSSGQPREQWDRLVSDVKSARARRVLLSVEQLSFAGPGAVAALLGSFPSAEVHVSYTARDLALVLPGSWQTRLRNRKSPTWQEFLASVREPVPKSYGANFWRAQDPELALAPWRRHIPAERIHLVTVPPPGSPPALLWERFCSVVGLQPDRYSLDVPRSNQSLGGVEAEVIRRLTAQVADELSPLVYDDLVKVFVAREVLERRTQSFKMVLPEREHEWLDPRAAQIVGRLGEAGYPLVGDLADLAPVHRPGRAPDDVSEAEVAAVQGELLAAMVKEMARRNEGEPWRGARVGDGAGRD